MEQLDQPRRSAAARTLLARSLCCAMAVLVAAAGGVVVALRIANPDAEPEGQNWWLVAWFAIAASFAVTGTALASRPGRRALGAAFVVCGISATMTGLAVQYAGYRDSQAGDGTWSWLADASDWSWPLAAGVLVGIVPWLLAAPRRGASDVIVAATGALVLASFLPDITSAPSWLGTAARWAVAGSATAAVVRLGRRWWRVRRQRADPLPVWILAGSFTAWLAIVPRSLEVPEWTHSGRHVMTAVLLLVTIPLLVGGAVVDAIRDSSSHFLGVSHGVLEWVVLASGIVALYTATVAGLGRLVGGSGPTWLLVGATGAIAVLLEPVRRHVRRLVDHLVYGARDDPLTVVQRVVDHLGADAGEDLLPTLVESLRRELRLDAVAIDLRDGDGWQPGARTGPPAEHGRVVPLRHGGHVVGRLVVGWRDGPSLRERDEAILEQLVGPVSLAVGWVRLADDLRRSSVAIVSAREEERRRIRRDLHDGLGPSLTGVSLGLRTALRQLERAEGTGVGPAPRPLLARIADEVDTVVIELKRIVRDLRPTALDQLGLVDAVAEFTRGLGDSLEVHLALPAEPVALPAAVEVATYRIVTEAVTNVVRHAQAACCWLTIEMGPSVVIDVVDDGIGIAAGGTHGVGMAAMRERAAELGGTVRVLPHIPHGTRVHVKLPAALP